MVGVVIATHGRLAEELLACAEVITGKLPRARAVSVSSNVPMDEARDALALAIREVEDGDGVLVLTDMLGGTPANLALGFLEDRVDVVTGVNLPMLLKLSTCRAAHASLSDIARLITGYGQKNITLASELLRARARGGGAESP
ncbi:MAG TPA: PTS sugar transporter subunit IIA [Anaeromyxobacteraceae bacterium]|nr:PTS sugar transporter subunit IIA [Anaeromyxobacteraceae bacterium]